MKRILIALLILALAGCAMLNEVPLVGDLPWVHEELNGNQAVVIGLTRVYPAAYNGWEGKLAGADVDARIVADMARENGLRVTLLLNEEATRERVVAAVVMAADRVPFNGLLFVYGSGHGGQIPDTSGDEADRMDETFCLWDGRLSDDVMRSIWEQIRPDIRVFFVMDACNSGTMYRAAPVDIRKSIPKGYTGQLIYYGACSDGASAFGTFQGGYMTTAMVDSWSSSNTYVGWFPKIVSKTQGEQIPVYAEYGKVTPEFRNTRVWR